MKTSLYPVAATFCDFSPASTISKCAKTNSLGRLNVHRVVMSLVFALARDH